MEGEVQNHEMEGLREKIMRKTPGNKETEKVFVIKTTNIKVPERGRLTWRQLWEVDMGTCDNA